VFVRVVWGSSAIHRGRLGASGGNNRHIFNYRFHPHLRQAACGDLLFSPFLFVFFLIFSRLCACFALFSGCFCSFFTVLFWGCFSFVFLTFFRRFFRCFPSPSKSAETTVCKGFGDSEQKAAESPMDKGIEKKIAIVDNFFQKRQKWGFLRVRIGVINRKMDDRRMTEPKKWNKKQQNSASGLAQLRAKWKWSV
jgi:hypothetical protein